MKKLLISFTVLALTLQGCWTASLYGPSSAQLRDDNPNEENSKAKPYKYGYQVDDGQNNKHYHNEKSDEYGNKKGQYGYMNAEGLYRHVSYIADKMGYRAYVLTNEPGTAPQNPADVIMEVEPVPENVKMSIEENDRNRKEEQKEMDERPQGYYISHSTGGIQSDIPQEYDQISQQRQNLDSIHSMNHHSHSSLSSQANDYYEQPKLSDNAHDENPIWQIPASIMEQNIQREERRIMREEQMKSYNSESPRLMQEPIQSYNPKPMMQDQHNLYNAPVMMQDPVSSYSSKPMIQDEPNSYVPMPMKQMYVQDQINIAPEIMQEPIQNYGPKPMPSRPVIMDSMESYMPQPKMYSASLRSDNQQSYKVKSELLDEPKSYESPILMEEEVESYGSQPQIRSQMHHSMSYSKHHSQQSSWVPMNMKAPMLQEPASYPEQQAQPQPYLPAPPSIRPQLNDGIQAYRNAAY